MGLMKDIDIQIRNGDLEIVSRCCEADVGDNDTDMANRCLKCKDPATKIVILDDGTEIEIGDDY